MLPTVYDSMRRFTFASNAIVAAVIIAFLAQCFFFSEHVIRTVRHPHQSAETGWSYLDGSDADLSNLTYTDHEAVVVRTLRHKEMQGADLCFLSTNVDFSVYIDGELIYYYYPQLQSICGITYGNDYHAIHFPDYKDGAELTLVAKDDSEGSMWAGFQYAKFTYSTDYFQELSDASLWQMAVTFATFVIGLIMIIIGFLYDRENGHRIEVLSLGTLAIVLSIWTNSGAHSMELITHNPGLVRVANYFSLMFITWPGTSFVAAVTKTKREKLGLVIAILTIVDFMLHITLIPLGILDYHDLLIVTHFLLVVGFGTIIYLFVQGIRNHVFKSRRRRILLMAFAVLAGGGSIDLVFYYLGQVRETSRFARLGLLAFVIIVSIYEIHLFVDVMKRGQEAKVMRELAHKDGLTDLENRMAFNECEAELLNHTGKSYIFVQLDINNLKKVNDTMGHAEGDAHIKGGANAIVESFGRYGRVFRVGGDEFVCVIETYHPEETFKNCELDLLLQVEKYNMRVQPKIPLAIAYGMAEYHSIDGNLNDIERLADERMYRCKEAQKLKEAQG